MWLGKGSYFGPWLSLKADLIASGEETDMKSEVIL
jgi:hypothetical protein